MADKPGLLGYLGAAFSWRWNLLALGAGIATAVISGTPEILLPVVGAAELLYLTGLISIPKFRQAIDMRHAASRRKESTQPAKVDARDQVDQLLNQLAPGLRKRFLEVRERCLTMGRIARGLSGGQSSADDLRTPGLDKLLWVFLRLLYAHQGLTRFLHETDDKAMQAQIEQLEKRLQKLGEGPDDDRLRKSLTGALATATLRLDNLRKAQGNAEYIEIELDRIEAKILALSEMSVNNQSPDFITSQVDAVAAGMAETESAIKELNYITGLGETLEEAPSILSRELA
ncbi:MAG: hypothetical protein KDI48_06555 [Xanthomonadales bacterium]|nr:hypothetical protein [Xanthomonadales bacterium]